MFLRNEIEVTRGRKLTFHSVYRIEPFTDFVETRRGKLSLICISLFPFLCKLNMIRRTSLVSPCTFPSLVKTVKSSCDIVN
jgi:hypothetical protein